MNEKMLKVINLLKNKNFKSFRTNYFIDNNYRLDYENIRISVEVGDKRTYIHIYQDEKRVNFEYISTFYFRQIENRINNILDGVYKYNIIGVNK